MAAQDRTAYPQFKKNPVVRELISTYTVTDEEETFLVRHTRQPRHRLTAALLLKTFQTLGYFPDLSDIPLPVMRHVRACLKYRVQVKPIPLQRTQLSRYYSLIRAYLKVEPYEKRGTDIVTRAAEEACKVIDNPADLINIALEHLVRECVELPAFSTLDRLVRRIRTVVNTRFFVSIEATLDDEQKTQLDALLTATDSGKTPLQTIKRLPKRASLKHFQELVEHVAVLDSLLETSKHLEGVPEAKRKHFASEARALDAAELKDFREPKRHALLLCLIDRARVQSRDDVAEMFIKRMSRIHARGKEAIEDLQPTANVGGCGHDVRCGPRTG